MYKPALTLSGYRHPYVRALRYVCRRGRARRDRVIHVVVKPRGPAGPSSRSAMLINDGMHPMSQVPTSGLPSENRALRPPVPPASWGTVLQRVIAIVATASTVANSGPASVRRGRACPRTPYPAARTERGDFRGIAPSPGPPLRQVPDGRPRPAQRQPERRSTRAWYARTTPAKSATAPSRRCSSRSHVSTSGTISQS